MSSDQPSSLYPPLARKFHDAESEAAVSAFWREHDIFARSIAQREGAPDWVFYEGPVGHAHQETVRWSSIN